MSKPSDHIPTTPNLEVSLKSDNRDKEIKHQFEKSHVEAINFAIVCNRPLLLTGEPGVGKTQLARAAAAIMGRAYLRHTVDAKTESRDLLWKFDAVARLADAQLAQSLKWNQRTCKKNLAIKNYLRPGPIWWGLDWQQASNLKGAKEPHQRDGGHHSNGVVVLIDEIDKAEIDVPNGLLEALGEGSFQPDGLVDPVRANGKPPLVIITSNRERSMPDAFIRRCLVLKITLPENEEELKAKLIERGQAHTDLKEPFLMKVAEIFVADRKLAKKENWRYQPGQAEYLDLLITIEELVKQGQDADELLEQARKPILQKGKSL